MAADALLLDAHGMAAGAVRITDAVDFDWPRWLDNIMQGPELRGPGVAEAFAIRASAERAAEYLFVRIKRRDCCDATQRPIVPHREPTARPGHTPSAP